ncbi:MAG: hypothetical protein J0H27_07970 [Xanthomonadales bacterium]|nr:hypothetical protein [Xanthomonadales bacterium]ODU92722.1 MAG: hypothetical protein ABT18_10800 [Rhodanobacter sp. SCN 66-43]OJY83914.1 MAG: hypothetical protein BGP23_15035 [Xanthomonadales bacterium 66-474]
MKPIASIMLFVLAALLIPPVHAGEKAGAKAAKACSAPVYRQFDFFAGDWDAYDAEAPDKVVAHNTVTVILDGCVVLEDYRQNDGLHGRSYSLYDKARGVWHQSWVTNHGDLLLLDGGMQGDRMVFEGVERKAGKPDALVRAAWYRQGDGVRETATRSLDGGKTWQPEFDILFKPHK